MTAPPPILSQQLDALIQRSTEMATTPTRPAPTTLAQHLEALIEQTQEDHSELLQTVEALGARMLANDAEVMRALEAVRDGQARRAGDIAAVVQVITSRVGFIPRPPIPVSVFNSDTGTFDLRGIH